MAKIDPESLIIAQLDEELNPGTTHSARIEISTRMGVAFSVSAEMDGLLTLIKSQKYLKSINVIRGISEPASLSFSLTAIEQDDFIMKLVPPLDGIFTTGQVTWKTILRTGSVCKVYINDEFKGIFLTNDVFKVQDERSITWYVECYGIQEFLRRQSLFYHLGNEAGAYSISFVLANVKTSDILLSPQKAITTIVEDFLFKTLQDGSFRFSNTSTIEDFLSVFPPPIGGISPISYYGFNKMLLQGLAPTQDYNIWEMLQRYQSPPFHELWVTNGGKIITLGSGIISYLPRDTEYLIFRPTPYDDSVLESVPEVPNLNVIPVGGEFKLPLHTVDESLLSTGNVITDYHIKEMNIGRNDNNAYSFYSIRLSGMGMDSNTSSKILPPYVDLDAMRYLGKRVFEAELAGLELTDKVGSADPLRASAIILAKQLQYKAYTWFKMNSEFNKGTFKTIWLKNLSEGEHIWYEGKENPEETGHYYINRYNLTFDVEALTVEYVLDVTRGTPKSGFPFRSKPFPQDALSVLQAGAAAIQSRLPGG